MCIRLVLSPWLCIIILEGDRLCPGGGGEGPGVADTNGPGGTVSSMTGLGKRLCMILTVLEVAPLRSEHANCITVLVLSTHDIRLAGAYPGFWQGGFL